MVDFSFSKLLQLLWNAWESFQTPEKLLIASAIVMILTFTLTDLLSLLISKKQKQPLGSLKKGSKEKAKGILFGNLRNKIVYSPTESEGHICVLGGSGLGKTSALLIPTLRAWTGNSFCIDISGDICRNVNAKNKLIFEPANSNSTPYNIFAPIDSLTDTNEQNEALAQLAFLLMPEQIKSDAASEYFLREGRKILTASLIAFYHKQMDFTAICEKIISSSWQRLFTDIDNMKNKDAIMYINSFQGSNEKNIGGCKQACDAAITLFATNAAIKRVVRRPHTDEIAYTPAVLENSNVFIVIEDAKLELYAPLLHILAAQTLEYLSCRPVAEQSKTVLLALDEFASLGQLDIIPSLRKLRKKHVRIMVLTQSMADLDLQYGREERMAMLTNFKYITVLGANDSDTQEYLSRLIGKHTVQNKSIATSRKSVTRTKSDSKDYIIEPSKLGHLGNKLLTIHDCGHIFLNKNFYFKK
ncbi:type IV secretory system conjugative DNA transfer family protein [Lachnoclostridium edouardi]|uniref:type IV secretory system conjugative DNA transfer family protein n=1 Tax=Lachnoclostridium edouardi TaxID=1926283 RepID=UPI000C7CFB14|nr:type IV secretory system conjugative DNA transfer family protein [Lachnoclostridium edouardi]